MEVYKMIKHIETQEELRAELAKGDVLLDFFATWCGPCRMLGPVLEGLDAKEDFPVQIVKVDTDEAPELAGAFQVESIPTLFFFSEGKLVRRYSGFLREDQIREFCKK